MFLWVPIFFKPGTDPPPPLPMVRDFDPGAPLIQGRSEFHNLFEKVAWGLHGTLI